MNKIFDTPTIPFLCRILVLLLWLLLFRFMGSIALKVRSEFWIRYSILTPCCCFIGCKC